MDVVMNIIHCDKPSLAVQVRLSLRWGFVEMSKGHVPFHDVTFLSQYKIAASLHDQLRFMVSTQKFHKD